MEHVFFNLMIDLAKIIIASIKRPRKTEAIYAELEAQEAPDRVRARAHVDDSLTQFRTHDAAPAPKRGRPSRQPIVVGEHFKLVFISVLALTALSTAALVALSVWIAAPSETLKDALSVLKFFAQAGFGTILGLLGGKAIR